MSLGLQNAVFRPTAAAGRSRVPVVPPRLSSTDVLGGLLVRWGFGRSSYRVAPGLYACGAPTPESPVLVTANYKLSFDALRKELAGLDAWLLALDTAGVNVWCAAGKGTFGTAELLRRVAAVRLESVVSHRVLVLPQLGASGVSAHEFAAASPFRIVYGPVRAADLPAFLAAGMRADAAMRRVRFGLAERLAVAPVELAHAWPAFAAALALSAVFPALSGGLSEAAFLRNAFAFCAPILVGTLAFPALLPLLPFRAFALKGAVLGALWSSVPAAVFGWGAAGAAAYALAATAVVSFIALNFTGASTYTNLSGAALEVKFGLPLAAAAFAAGAALALAIGR